ncbi:MAG: HD domain-containing protein [Candidatus Woesearchaeota archaeon]
MINIRDPIYRIITLEDEFLPLLNHPFMQRLRAIKQNSMLFHVYPSAKHDRFSHSLGTYYLALKLSGNGLVDMTADEKRAFKQAALLHDIGHGPYSHSWEKLVDGFDHEKMSVRIIRDIFGLPEAAKIVGGSHRLSPLLSSVLDVDKLDYMARDSYFCGVGYGDTDVDRIIEHMFVEDGHVVIDSKVVSSAEHVIMGRISLFSSTYYHHSVRSMDALLEKIFARARTLYAAGGDLFVGELLKKCFENELETDDFLAVDDALIDYHLNKWRYSSDTILGDLVTRFHSRNGFSALDAKRYGLQADDVLPLPDGYDEQYYFLLDTISKSIYENELLVKTADGRKVPLSHYSPYVAKINDVPLQKTFLVGPKEVFTKHKRT